MALDPFEPIVFGAEGAELVATVLPYGLTIHTIGTEEGEDFIGGPNTRATIRLEAERS